MTYESEVLADSPYVYYRLDETGTPGTVTDATVNGRDGTYVNTPTLEEPAVSALLGTAVLFTQASSEHITTSNISGFGSLFDTGYTIECWVRTTTSSNWSTIVGIFNTGGGTAFQLALNQGSAGTHRMFIRAEGGTDASFTFTDNLLRDGNWHHLVVRDTPSDATNRGVFIDGVSVTLGGVGDNLGAATTANFAHNVMISATNNSGAGPGDIFDGVLDEFALYTTVLSNARITAHFDAAFAENFVEGSGFGAARGAGLASPVVVAASATGLGAARGAGLASPSVSVGGSGLGAVRAAGLASATVLPYVARDMTLEVGPTSPSMIVAESVIAGSVAIGPTETERVP